MGFQNDPPNEAQDFKSLVSTDFTMPALVTKVYYHIIFF